MNRSRLAHTLMVAGALLSCPARAAIIRPAVPSAQDAPIALLVDVTSGQVLFSREADRRFAPASITKVMTLYTAFEHLSDKKLALSQPLRVRPETFAQWRRVGSTMYLAQNTQVPVVQLLHGIASVSANDGAIVLAEGAAGTVGAWLQAMNANARRLGMNNSHFATPNGWPDGGATYTTAHDLVTLADAILNDHPQFYDAFFGQPGFSYGGITQRNHDPISGVVPGADGMKTGYTDQAGYGFLGSAERDGRRLVMVVATSDTARARDRASRGLIEWGFQEFEAHRLLQRDQAVAHAKVQGGAQRTVALVTQRPLAVTVPRGTKPKVTMAVRYVGPIQAPVEAGDIVGRLHVRVSGMAPYSVPLRAGERVARAGAVQRVTNGIAGWFS